MIGLQAIHCAAQRDNSEAIAALVEAGVDVNAASIEEGFTALVSAASSSGTVLSSGMYECLP